MVFCLERGVDYLQTVQLMPLHPNTPLSLVSFKSRLVLPFWYGLTQVVLEKKPLNGCSSSSSSSSSFTVYSSKIQRKWLTDNDKVILHHVTPSEMTAAKLSRHITLLSFVANEPNQTTLSLFTRFAFYSFRTCKHRQISMPKKTAYMRVISLISLANLFQTKFSKKPLLGHIAVRCSVVVCLFVRVLDTLMSRAKTAESVQMLVGVWTQ